jgi:hypothetical protein
VCVCVCVCVRARAFSDGGTGIRYVGNNIADDDAWDVMRRLHQDVPYFQTAIRLQPYARKRYSIYACKLSTPYPALKITRVTAVLCEGLLFPNFIQIG